VTLRSALLVLLVLGWLWPLHVLPIRGVLWVGAEGGEAEIEIRCLSRGHSQNVSDVLAQYLNGHRATPLLAALTEGITLYESGNETAGILALSRLRLVHKNFLLCGDTLWAQSRNKEAVDNYLLSWRLNRDVTRERSRMFAALCSESRSKGSPGLAVGWCKRAAQAEPSFWTLVDYGRTLLETGLDEDAEMAFDRASEFVGSSVDQGILGYWQGAILRRRGEREQAAVLMQHAASLAPSIAWGRAALGDVLAELGRYEAATHEYAAALLVTEDVDMRRVIREKLDLLPGTQRPLNKVQRMRLAGK